MRTIKQSEFSGGFGLRLVPHPILLILAAVLAMTALWANSAQAFQTHLFSKSFTPESGFGFPLGVAINQSTEEVYVTDYFNGTVYAFEASGTPDPVHPRLIEAPPGSAPYQFANPYGVAVDNSAQPTAGDVYVAEASGASVIQFNSSGVRTSQAPITVTNIPAKGTAQSGGLPNVVNGGGFLPTGVAVTSNGEIYVADQANNVVDLFESNGNFVSQVASGDISGPNLISVDSSGNLYVAQNGSGLLKFSPSGTCLNSCAPIDPAANLGVAIDPAGHIYADEGDRIAEFTSAGSPIGSFGEPTFEPAFSGLSSSFDLAVNNSTGRIYAANFGYGNVSIFGPLVTLPDVTTGPPTSPGQTSATLTGHVDLGGGGEITGCHFEYGTDTSYSSGSLPCEPAAPLASATEVTAHLGGLTSETTYHYRLYAKNAEGAVVGQDETFTPHAVPGLETKPATSIDPSGAQLHGYFVGNGEDTHYYFEWGTDTSYGNTSAIPPGTDAGSGVGPTSIYFDVSNLNPVTTYHFRVVASNSAGTSYGGDESFTTLPSAPIVSETVTGVHSESAQIHAQINPGGGETKYHFEYATDQEYKAGETYGNVVPIPDGEVGSGSEFVAVSSHLENLASGTTYHWRVVASNMTGTTYGPDRIFTTFPFVAVLEDPCPNVHVRQQTGAAQLLDCRAYELVSAANTGGYDVESDLVPNQSPYPDYPNAETPSRVLYAVHDGGIPGTNHPTNRGPDPYVATRNPESGWSTEYAGVPANNPFAAEPFSSIPSGVDANLETFAFGGPEGCSPCFEGGYTGVPIHLPNGSLVQGMVGPESPGPGAKPDSFIAKDLSANGEHFVFGSTSRFAPGGNSGGDVSIYDHNLRTGETNVVSNTPEGEDLPEALPCLQGAGSCHSPGDGNGIAELDISGDGTRILLGQKVSTDADGNVYWHLYMDIGDSIRTIDLTPGTTHGVLYDGMTSDGARVFFTTKDALSTVANQDTDESADIYQAQVSAGSATLTRISTGENSGNSNACEPVSNENGEHWNTVGAAKNCDALAIDGTGGIGTIDGAAYFLSPEKLDGAAKGVENQPNLYLATPGSTPHFIVTLDPNDPVVVDSLKAAEQGNTADFEVTPSGRFAAFVTKKRLSDYESAGFSEVYRYEATAGSLDCVSCNPSRAEATGDASMASSGLSLTADGRVFFNSNDALVLPDADSRQDVYEWEPQGTGNCQPESPAFFELSADCVSLISSGTGQFASSLLGVGSSGTDAYFFTRATMTPQVENGDKVKIYDARELGGFPFTPEEVPCKASDECHGRGTPIPPRPTIASGAGTGGNIVSKAHRKCKPGFVRRHHKCVRKHRQPRRHQSGGNK